MSLLDKPVSMNELGKAVVEDIGAVSQRTLYQEKSDLSAVWESMYEKGLQRKVSTQCYFNPDELEIPDHHKTPPTQTDGAELRTDKNEPDSSSAQAKKDLASVHLERALNTSRANWHNHGRHYRRKRTLSKEDSKIFEH
ncbi:uncharacterized protein LOC110239936 [Exaiptasia diaphana]|uniref:Uncharacterized protein n=1 Tax=Exaiptasia diaphana TaxID=2652724 RepID=A0A913XA82_EXADI|nr:uncharacterized protein LOC110239936 [Exaiptasia diaphana]